MESLITFVFWPQSASGVQPISFCHVGAQSLHFFFRCSTCSNGATTVDRAAVGDAAQRD